MGLRFYPGYKQVVGPSGEALAQRGYVGWVPRAYLRGDAIQKKYGVKTSSGKRAYRFPDNLVDARLAPDSALPFVGPNDIAMAVDAVSIALTKIGAVAEVKDILRWPIDGRSPVTGEFKFGTISTADALEFVVGLRPEWRGK